VAPPIDALREAIWLGQAPRAADVLYLAVAAVVSLSLGAFVFSRIDDRLAVEL
jgi:ABC-type polysaccharide/polyol phosphate export permease